MTRDKKLLIYWKIMQKLDLKPFRNQNKIKQKEQVIRYYQQNMLQRLPIALTQVKAGNNSESLLNEIRQIVYSFYQSGKITKKVYNNIIDSIQ